MVIYETLNNGYYFKYNNKIYKKIKGIIVTDLYNIKYKIKPGALVTPVSKEEVMIEKRRIINRRKKIDIILSKNNKK